MGFGQFWKSYFVFVSESDLIGRNARAEFTGVPFAGAGQSLDTGAKMVHLAENTTSLITTKSISKGGG